MFITKYLHPGGDQILEMNLVYSAKFESSWGIDTVPGFLQTMFSHQLDVVQFAFSSPVNIGFCAWLFAVSSISLYMLPSRVDMHNSLIGACLLLFVCVVWVTLTDTVAEAITMPPILVEWHQWLSPYRYIQYITFGLTAMLLVAVYSLLLSILSIPVKMIFPGKGKTSSKAQTSAVT